MYGNKLLTADVWQMFRVVLEERKRREIDPTLSVLRECVKEAGESTSSDPQTEERLNELLNFLETMSAWYDQMRKIPTSSLLKIIKLGNRIQKVVGS